MTATVVQRPAELGGGFECECGHEFQYQASEADGRPLWFHIAGERDEGEQAGCRAWRPPPPEPTGVPSGPPSSPPVLSSGLVVEVSP